ncbi:MAG: regulatory protein RecX [Clostridiales bacterium]|jgi:regulatory protein|nr:regulatory protein RecX [Clostridiales bacterium]HOA34327.1 regulatory protein RecX [Clostridiales bacterium]HOJ35209.1 regulatory protein RecX [Clostridiales bacterium]HOL79104.1 regulatory protein RecX [Clostridiales bacterium]HPP69090.1 regulatory protein RecX [Clostridiales bacterium]
MRFSIERLKGGKVRLLADGEQFAIVTEGFLRDLKLKAGDEITVEDIDSIINEKTKAAALNKAMRLITLRMHSRGELVQKLKREFDGEAAEYAADELENMGLINDAEFSSLFGEELFERKGFARARIIDELKSRGVSSDTARAAVEFISDEDEFKRLIVLIEDSFSANLSDEKERRRVINNLIRRGYKLYDIERALGSLQTDTEYF